MYIIDAITPELERTRMEVSGTHMDISGGLYHVYTHRAEATTNFQSCVPYTHTPNGLIFNSLGKRLGGDLL